VSSRRRGLFRLHHDEEGVTAIIVALCLIALFGMLVLVVDVGGLLYKRRELVSGSDAAALAAAKTCSVRTVDDPTDPQVQADTAAVANVNGLTGSNGGIVDNPWNCSTATRTPRGYVTVQYSYQQQLFFAGIFGASNRTVTTAATAAWGPLGGGNAIPIVLESSQFQGQCDVPNLDVGTKCSFWYNNGNASIGDANWGFLNLDQWDVSTGTNCNSSGGASNRSDYILNNFGSDLVLAEPGPTYVCSSTGHASSNWQDLVDRMNGVGCKASPCPGPVILMPVNDCNKQIDKSGNIVPCGMGTPDKFAIIGFTTLELSNVYKGNDPAAYGTPGTAPQPGDCGNKGTALGTAGQGDLSLGGTQFGGWYLPDFADQFCGASRSADVITPPVTVTAPKGSPALVACTSVTSGTPAPSGCDYFYNPSTKILSWWNATSKNSANAVKFDWTVNGTPGSAGACPAPGGGPRPPDANAVCLVTTWLGYTDQNGTVGDGPDFGTQGHVLCDFTYNSCPDGVKP
jgi:Flp pilus assembly protein TadG